MRDPANHGPGVRTAEEGEVGCDVLRPAVEPEQVRATGQLEVGRRVGDDLGLQRGVGSPSEREVGRGVRSAQAFEVRAPEQREVGSDLNDDLGLERRMRPADQLQVGPDVGDPAVERAEVRTAEEPQVRPDVDDLAAGRLEMDAPGELEVGRDVGHLAARAREVRPADQLEVRRNVNAARALGVGSPDELKVGCGVGDGVGGRPTATTEAGDVAATLGERVGCGGVAARLGVGRGVDLADLIPAGIDRDARRGMRRGVRPAGQREVRRGVDVGLAEPVRPADQLEVRPDVRHLLGLHGGVGAAGEGQDRRGVRGGPGQRGGVGDREAGPLVGRRDGDGGRVLRGGCRQGAAVDRHAAVGVHVAGGAGPGAVDNRVVGGRGCRGRGLLAFPATGPEVEVVAAAMQRRDRGRVHRRTGADRPGRPFPRAAARDGHGHPRRTEVAVGNADRGAVLVAHRAGVLDDPAAHVVGGVRGVLDDRPPGRRGDGADTADTAEDRQRSAGGDGRGQVDRARGLRRGAEGVGVGFNDG